MTNSTNNRTTTGKGLQRQVHDFHQTWWSRRLSVTDLSFEEEAEPIEKSLEEFWTGKFGDYKRESKTKNKEQIDLTSIGESPEGFTKVLKIVDRCHSRIQGPLDRDSNPSEETSIESIIEDIPRSGPVMTTNLKREGYEKLNDLKGVTRDELIEVDRVGTETAARLLEFTCQETTESHSDGGSIQKPLLADDVDLQELSNEIPGVGSVSLKKLQKEGYNTVGDVRPAATDELTEIEQIGKGTVSKLTQYIEHRTERPTPTASQTVADDTPIEEFTTDVPGVGRVLISKMNQAGYETVGDLRAATIDELTSVENIGKKKAELLLKHVHP